MSCSVVDRRSAMSGGNSMCRLRGSTASLSSPVSKTAAGGGSGPGSGPGSKQLNSGASPQGPSPTGPFRPTKPCCFCWCCCCSCSCLVKGVEDNGLSKNSNNADLLNCDGEPPPSIEEMRSWGKSFDKLMKSSAGRKVFRDFLRCEYSEENILFWLACEELKKESNPDAVEERARFIYEDYISILSPKEVSLDSRVREIVNRNMVEPTPHTFDEAQLQIYTLMHRDSYPRFVNSALYKTLAQIKNEEECVSGGTITGVGSSAISGGGGVDTSVSDGGVGNVSAGANSGAGANNGTGAISGACATNNEGNGSVSTTTKSTITATGGSTSATNDLPESPTAQHVSLVAPVTPTNRTSISPSSVKKQSSPLSQKSGNND